MNNQNLNNNESNNSINNSNNGNNTFNNFNNIEVLGEDLTSQNQNNQIDYNSFIKPPEQKKQDPNELLNAVPNPDMMISSPTTNMISSDDLMEDFIGKNYEKISKRKYNFAAFFFNIFYLMYRKMYLEGIVLFILMIGLQLLLIAIPFVPALIDLIINLLLLFMFNKIYVKKAKKKIEKIINKNKNKSISDLRNICKKAGGTNLILTIILSIVLILLTSVILVFVLPTTIIKLMFGNLKFDFSISGNSSINENIDYENNDNSDNNEDNKYHGELNYKESVVINDKINMGYLLIFKPDGLNSDYLYSYSYQTDASNPNSNCSFTLGVVNNYDKSKELIDEIAQYNELENSAITYVTNKNLIFDSVTVSHDLKEVYYNAINNKDEVYLLTYEISSSADQSICNAFYKGIMDSIEFK